VTTLILVRHGETDNNAKGTFNGCREDQPLNEHGREQAARLGEYLKDVNIDAIYASSMRRAIETAEGARGTRTLPIGIEPALRETDFGDWDGCTWADVGEKSLTQREIWAHTPHLFRFPGGGETIDEVKARITARVTELVQKHRGDTVLMASHGMALSILLLSLMYLPMSRLRHIEGLHNTGFARLEIEDDGVFTVTDFNAVPHLTPALTMINATSNCPAPFAAPQILGQHIYLPFAAAREA